MYILFPPMRNEVMNLEVVSSEKEAKTKKAAIFIKDSKNIFLYFNEIKKHISQFHSILMIQLLKVILKIMLIY